LLLQAFYLLLAHVILSPTLHHMETHGLVVGGGAWRYFRTAVFWLNAGAVLLWVGSGYVTAAVARRAGTLHGAVCGLVASLFVTLSRSPEPVPLIAPTDSAGSLSLDLVSLLLVSASLGAFGGFLWDLWRWYRGPGPDDTHRPRHGRHQRREPPFLLVATLAVLVIVGVYWVATAAIAYFGLRLPPHPWRVDPPYTIRGHLP